MKFSFSNKYIASLMMVLVWCGSDLEAGKDNKVPFRKNNQTPSKLSTKQKKQKKLDNYIEQAREAEQEHQAEQERNEGPSLSSKEPTRKKPVRVDIEDVVEGNETEETSKEEHKARTESPRPPVDTPNNTGNASTSTPDKQPEVPKQSNPADLTDSQTSEKSFLRFFKNPKMYAIAAAPVALSAVIVGRFAVVAGWALASNAALLNKVAPSVDSLNKAAIPQDKESLFDAAVKQYKAIESKLSCVSRTDKGLLNAAIAKRDSEAFAKHFSMISQKVQQQQSLGFFKRVGIVINNDINWVMGR